MGEIIDLEDGQISYRARKYREEIRALVESAEYAIESYADRLQHIMGLADHIAECSPFQKWLAENGAEIEFDEGGKPKRLRIDTILSMRKSDSFENARRVAQEAIDAWRHSGNDVVDFASVAMVWKAPEGGRDSHRVGRIADW